MNSSSAETEPKKKRVVGRPFQKGEDERRAKPAEATDLRTFARDLLRSRRVQRAIRRKGERGQLTPQEIRVLAELASEAPQGDGTDQQRRYREVLDGLKRLSKAELLFQYQLDKKQRGDIEEDREVSVRGYEWRLDRRDGAVAGPRPPVVVPPPSVADDRPPERPLAETKPLAEASERLKQLEAAREVGPRTPSRETVVVVVEDRRPEMAARLQDGLRRPGPAPTYAAWRSLPVSPPNPDRDGRSSLVRCDRCGVMVEEHREAAQKHDATGRDGRCRGATFSRL